MAPEQKPELLAGIMPFFIVDSLEATISFYVGHLGFHTEMSLPESEPFFAILRRDSVPLMVKEIRPDTRPQPNHSISTITSLNHHHPSLSNTTTHARQVYQRHGKNGRLRQTHS